MNLLKSNYLKKAISTVANFNLNFILVRNIQLKSLESNNLLSAENNHAYNILKNLPSVYTIKSNYLDKINLHNNIQSLTNNDWVKENDPKNVLNAFLKISKYCHENNLKISDTQFDNIVEGILLNCKKYEYEDLLKLLQALIKLSELENSKFNHNFIELWSALDDMLLEKTPELNCDKILYLADHLFQLKLVHQTDFIWHCTWKLSRYVDKLNKQQFLHTMFILNLCRRPLENMFDMEHRFSKLINEMTIDEIAIVCMAFFKTKTQFKIKKNLEKIIQRTIDELDTIHNITLTCILKIIRFSPSFTVIDSIKKLMNAMITKIDNVPMICMAHISLLGTNLHMFNPKLLDTICNKVVQNLDQLRLKDLERLTFVTSYFNFQPNLKSISNKLDQDDDRFKFFKLIRNELYKRDEEIQSFPKCLSCTVQYFTISNYYATDLISKVLDPQFIINTYGKNKMKYGRELFSLDCSIDIEVNNYTGNRLNKTLKEQLVKFLTEWPPEEGRPIKSAANKHMWDIMKNLIKLFGDNHFINFEHVLPHFERADIIFCMDKDSMTPIRIDSIFKNFKLSDVKPAPKPSDLSGNQITGKNLIWYAAVVGAKTLLIQDLNIPLGLLNMKLRQLKLIGYTPILVPWFQWQSLGDSSKIDYLKNLIATSKV